MLCALMLLLASCASSAPKSVSSDAQAQAVEKPNIIFILSDDVGLGHIGCFGGDTFKTPNIDALAAGGTRFERCYSTPLCGPSRAQILTGRYPFRTGMISNSSGGAMKPANEVMIPTVLKKAGYVTASVGKWNQLPLQPGDWGFDEYLRFPGSGRY
jgi:arylsulfatase A-like enzyme